MFAKNIRFYFCIFHRYPIFSFVFVVVLKPYSTKVEAENGLTKGIKHKFHAKENWCVSNDVTTCPWGISMRTYGAFHWIKNITHSIWRNTCEVSPDNIYPFSFIDIANRSNFLLNFQNVGLDWISIFRKGCLERRRLLFSGGVVVCT